MNRHPSSQRPFQQPGRFHRTPRAILRRILPAHPRVGFPWLFLRDGSVTFHESGFVAANSPALLLARHNWETRYIQRALTNIEVQRSIEIGCGYGRLTPSVAEHSHHHIGTDINKHAVGLARTVYPMAEFLVASAPQLPIRHESFDLVCTWTALQHVPPDRISDACREIVRILRPGGLLLTCEETRSPNRPVRRPHTWHRTPDDYARLLTPLRLVDSTYVLELDRIPGMASPGQVMVWRCSLGEETQR